MSLIYGKQHQTKEITPTVSLVIAAYNEEKVIREKILNDLNLDYPKDKIEIIIVSDGSTDNTPEIVQSFKSYGVIGIHQPHRKGKTAAINRAINHSKNEILIFSDANSMFKKNAIQKLVRHFYDASIGGVCGRKSIILNSGRRASEGDSFFWKYESLLKQAESKLGSIPTADGEIFAIRKNLYRHIDPSIINDDMAITLNIVSENKRVIYEHTAITEEEASISLRDDFNVKSRMVYGGIQIIETYHEVLNPIKSFFGLQFFFHKTLRYFMWLLLVSIFLINLLCIDKHPFYFWFLVAQLSFYTLAILGYLMEKFNYTKFTIFYFPYYYCNVNLAAFKGFIFYLKKHSGIEVWKKAKR